MKLSMSFGINDAVITYPMQANANSVCNGLFGAIHAIESTNNDTLIIRPRDMSEAYYLLH